MKEFLLQTLPTRTMTTTLENWSAYDLYVQFTGEGATLTGSTLPKNGGSMVVPLAGPNLSLFFLEDPDPSTGGPMALRSTATMFQIPANEGPSGIEPIGPGSYAILTQLLKNSKTPSGLLAVYESPTGPVSIVPESSSPGRPLPFSMRIVNNTPFQLTVQYPSTPDPDAPVVPPWGQVTTKDYEVVIGGQLQFNKYSPVNVAKFGLFQNTISFTTYNSGSYVTFYNDIASSVTTPVVPTTAPPALTRWMGGAVVALQPSFPALDSVWNVAGELTGNKATSEWTMTFTSMGPQTTKNPNGTYPNCTMLAVTNYTPTPYCIGPTWNSGTPEAPVPGPRPTNLGPDDTIGLMGTLLKTVNNHAELFSSFPRTQIVNPGETVQVLASSPPLAGMGFTWLGFYTVATGSDAAATNGAGTFLTYLPVEVAWQHSNASPTFGYAVDPDTGTPMILNGFGAGEGFPGLPAPAAAAEMCAMVAITTCPLLQVYVDASLPPSPTSAPTFTPLIAYPALSPVTPGVYAFNGTFQETVLLQTALPSSSVAAEQPVPYAVGPTFQNSIYLLNYDGPIVFMVGAAAPAAGLQDYDYSFTYNESPVAMVAFDGTKSSFVPSAVAQGFSATAIQGGSAVRITLPFQPVPNASSLTASYMSDVCTLPGFRDCRSVASVSQDTCIGYFSNTMGNPCVAACTGRQYAGSKDTGNTTIDGTCQTVFEQGHCGAYLSGGLLQIAPSAAMDADPACACIRRASSTLKFSLDGSAEPSTFADYIASTKAFLPQSIIDVAGCWWPPCNAGIASALPDTFNETKCLQSYTNCFAAVGQAVADPTSVIKQDIVNACGPDAYVQGSAASVEGGGGSGSGSAAAPAPSFTTVDIIVVVVVVVVVVAVILGSFLGVMSKRRRMEKATFAAPTTAAPTR